MGRHTNTMPKGHGAGNGGRGQIRQTPKVQPRPNSQQPKAGK